MRRGMPLTTASSLREKQNPSKLHHNSKHKSFVGTKVNQNMLNLNVMSTNLRDIWHIDPFIIDIHSSL